jgi:hypothetical protein
MEAMKDQAELEEFGKRWAEAELARDRTLLDALTQEDFMLVGPLGFVQLSPIAMPPGPQQQA